MLKIATCTHVLKNEHYSDITDSSLVSLTICSGQPTPTLHRKMDFAQMVGKSDATFIY